MFYVLQSLAECEDLQRTNKDLQGKLSSLRDKYNEVTKTVVFEEII